MRYFVVVVAAAGLLLVGCSPDTTDFREDAEKFIDDNDDVTDELGVDDLDDAECAEPTSKEVDSTFECTAIADDGSSWSFTAVITGERAYSIVAAEPTPTPEASA